MKIDLRANLQRVGDVFVGAVQKTADYAMDCSKGVVLTYDIKALRCRKKMVSMEISERVSALVSGGKTDVSRDDELNELVARLNGLEKEIENRESGRAGLATPYKAIFSRRPRGNQD